MFKFMDIIENILIAVVLLLWIVIVCSILHTVPKDFARIKVQELRHE
jgi:hypothetical protein